MKNLKKDLQAVNKELKALAKKTESLLKAVDKLEKPKAAKKTSVKNVALKKAAAKKPVPKKATTAVDTVLAIINRYKKGVGTCQRSFKIEPFWVVRIEPHQFTF